MMDAVEKKRHYLRVTAPDYRNSVELTLVGAQVPQETKMVPVDKAEAVFADGVLTLTPPKTEETRAKQIAIKTEKPAKPALAESK